ncbi:MAG TPA: hypothetical protein VF666_10590 [Pyrinomonadaceae bacterium]|jgi:hypothetical protein
MSSNTVQNSTQVAAAQGGEPQVAFDVTLPRANASREEIARAVFQHFGFSDADAAFLRQRFGTDPVAYFARTLQFNPRSISRRTDGQASIRIQLDQSDFNTLRTLAAERRAQNSNPLTTPTTTTLNPNTTLASRQGITTATNTRATIENRLPLPSPAPTPTPTPTPTTTTTTTTNDNPTTTNRNEEGVGAFFEGAIAGDFSGNDSWSKVGGQTLVGVIPIAGQIADARDTAAAIGDIWNGKEGGWVNLGAALVGWVPLFGDAAKGAFRVGRKAVAVGGEEVLQRTLTQSAQEVTERTIREGTETTVENTDVLARRGFSQPTTTGDPNLPAGEGFTDKFGNITFSTRGTPTDRALVLHHEKVHQFLSPKFNLLREFRADARMTLYQKSSFMRYLEEAMAETYAQLRVNGIKGLPDGIRFPITNGYVELRHVVAEGAIGAVTVGGITYGAYVIADHATQPNNDRNR